jgi:hypothetical protein
MMHLGIFHAVVRESRLFELPSEMIAAIFKNMAE